MLDATLFLQAQAGCIDTVYAELRAGRKASHWMWFVFPQLKVLGRSQMAQRYGLADLAEAQAYLAHPVLGDRLRQCARLVMGHAGRSAHDIMGSPDDLKLRSCMTLFAQAARAAQQTPDEALFTDVLAQFYGGESCAPTIKAIGH
jgi:uncharacterized protein (DUF1810 family)